MEENQQKNYPTQPEANLKSKQPPDQCDQQSLKKIRKVAKPFFV
jgi:hypothetical protein